MAKKIKKAKKQVFNMSKRSHVPETNKYNEVFAVPTFKDFYKPQLKK